MILFLKNKIEQKSWDILFCEFVDKQYSNSVRFTHDSCTLWPLYK